MIISSFHNTEKLEFTVEFLSPTSNIEFNDLLRQWWRVVNRFKNGDDRWQREGKLFGSVVDYNKSTTSKVRILAVPGESCKSRKGSYWDGETFYREIVIGTDNYYMIPESKVVLQVLYPCNARNEIITALQYVDAFGTLGKYGYGSISLSGEGISRLGLASIKSRHFSELVSESNKDYPNCFGHDEKGMLIWDSVNQDDWAKAMTLLTSTFQQTRYNVPFATTNIQDRYADGHTGINLAIMGWVNICGHLPPQLQFMVKRNQKNQIVARILHLPHFMNKPWPNTLPSQIEVWQQVHKFLDEQKQFQRVDDARL
jgi:hypothetical protein